MTEATLSTKNQIVIPREAREALGVKPGVGLGGLLHEIRERQLQGELTTPDEARAWVREKLKREA